MTKLCEWQDWSSFYHRIKLQHVRCNLKGKESWLYGWPQRLHTYVCLGALLRLHVWRPTHRNSSPGLKVRSYTHWVSPSGIHINFHQKNSQTVLHLSTVALPQHASVSPSMSASHLQKRDSSILHINSHIDTENSKAHVIAAASNSLFNRPLQFHIKSVHVACVASAAAREEA